jgi:DNA-binding response OmpR family regulator
MQRVLVIEKDLDVVNKLTSNLKKMGCDIVKQSDSFADTIDTINSCCFDLVLIDANNIETINAIKDFCVDYSFSNLPPIYTLSLRDGNYLEEIESVVGFVLKPTKLIEFKSESSNICNEGYDGSIYRDLGHGYIYNISSAELKLDSRHIHLTKREKTLLELMIKSNNKIISNEQILYSVWDEKVVSDKTIRTLIKQLNDKFNFNFIQNVYGQGYKTETIETIINT